MGYLSERARRIFQEHPGVEVRLGKSDTVRVRPVAWSRQRRAQELLADPAPPPRTTIIGGVEHKAPDPTHPDHVAECERMQRMRAMVLLHLACDVEIDGLETWADSFTRAQAISWASRVDEAWGEGFTIREINRIDEAFSEVQRNTGSLRDVIGTDTSQGNSSVPSASAGA